MFCNKCGKPINEDAKFCMVCGSEVSTNQEIKDTVVNNKNLKGLGGWLVLVILGLFISVGYQVYGMFESINLFNDTATIEYLRDYIPEYSGLLKFEFIDEIAFSVFAIYLIYLFFKKNKKFPKYYIGFLASFAVYIVLDYILLASISAPSDAQQVINDVLSDQAGEVGRSVIGGIIWIAYTIKSKRVKETFIEG